MIRRVVLCCLVALGLLVAPLPALAASSNSYWLSVVDELNLPITSGVTCHVLTADSVNTAPTIYSDAALSTTATNPITASSAGRCGWYGPTSTSTYDVIVYHQRGIARLQAWGVNDHRVVINKMTPYKHVRFAFSQNASETDTGIDLPEGAMVFDIVIEVTTAVAGSSINVGLLSTETGGDADGFAAGVFTISTGFSRPAALWVNAPLGRTYVQTASRGALLALAQRGSDQTAASPGYYMERAHLVGTGTATSISYSTSAHAVAGFVHLFYTEVANR